MNDGEVAAALSSELWQDQRWLVLMKTTNEDFAGPSCERIGHEGERERERDVIEGGEGRGIRGGKSRHQATWQLVNGNWVKADAKH